ncbi:manganese efflux pump MntP family protein [Pseudoroseomonas cervicalis]|uniref:manganese efflux pump MntP n=1 Tax=Teichococcus cervicalis TaxID=204525 RepID=UPI0022F19FFA|nr:manganese efflux pump MntP family protein [Pseudoroseomonas cervicalis]WBV43197.1 manganese efflux pump MntP family protein [Pseudoroseomonas cervicalis]
MSPVSIAVLALGMSVDAFAAAISRGAGARQVRLAEAMRTGLVFGSVEAVTPLIGWGAGMLAAGALAAVDHWIAFALLGLVGGRMLFEAARRPAEDAPAGRSPWMLLATAVGTSIDAMAVGVSLAFLEAEIWVIAAAIGAATFCMATGGVLFGRLLGRRFGRVAEALAGIALILLGAAILHEHLSA